MKTEERVMVKVEGNFEDKIKVGISKSKADKMFNILLENYSNARAAMIREYTSNAWDAHAELKTDEPVILQINYDDGGWFVEIIDVGVGMSKEFMEEKFSMLLESTKEDTDDLIGGWGIGSKSGLAYTDQVQITSIKEGYKVEYLLFRETTGSPNMLLTSEEETEEHSGTTIKIYLKEGNRHYDSKEYSYYDEHEFVAKLAAKELAYFDNVYFKFYAHNLKIKRIADNYNKGKIFEGKHFKYRTDMQYSTDMHIVLGKVAYPIAWKELEVKPVNIPVGVKFDIGELMVNMTREQIRYSDEAKKLIKARLELVKQELVDKFNKANVPHTDVHEWLLALKRRKDSQVYHKFVDGDDVYSLDVTELEDYLVKTTFGPIEHLNLDVDFNKTNPFFFLEVTNVVENGYLRRSTRTVKELIGQNVVIYRHRDIESKEFKKYIKNCFFVKEYSTKYTYTLSKRELNLVDFGTGAKFKKRYDDEGNAVDQITIKPQRVQIAKTIFEYKRIMLEQLAKRNKIIYYDDFVIPNEWFEEQKRIAKENRVAKTRLEGTIAVRDYIGSLEELNLANLNTFKGVLIYGFLKDAERLTNVRELLYRYNMGFDSTDDSKRVLRIYRISQQNEKYITKFKNAIHVNSFLMSRNRILQKLCTIAYIKSKENLFLDSNISDKFAAVNVKVGIHFKRIRKFYLKNVRYNFELKGGMLEELLETRKTFKVQYLDIEYDIAAVEEYIKDIPIAQYVHYIPDYVLAEQVKKIGKRVNPIYYKQGENPETFKPTITASSVPPFNFIEARMDITREPIAVSIDNAIIFKPNNQIEEDEFNFEILSEEREDDRNITVAERPHQEGA